MQLSSPSHEAILKNMSAKMTWIIWIKRFFQQQKLMRIKESIPNNNNNRGDTSIDGVHSIFSSV